MSENVVGIQKQPLCSYNSASTLRVKALRSIGGFPAEFWLDFMDHAVFHALFVRGYRVYVMLATLTHDSSYADHRNLPSMAPAQHSSGALSTYKKAAASSTDFCTAFGCCGTAEIFENPTKTRERGRRLRCRLFFRLKACLKISVC